MLGLDDVQMNCLYLYSGCGLRDKIGIFSQEEDTACIYTHIPMELARVPFEVD